MSVINQMLKDLEQRTPEQGQVAMPVSIRDKPSTIKIVLISLVVFVSLSLLGFYIWDLQKQLTSSELKVKEQGQSPVANVGQGLPQKPVETLLANQQRLKQELIPEKILLTEAKADRVIELPQQSIAKEKVSLPEPTLINIVSTRAQVQPEPSKPKFVSQVRAKPTLVNPEQVKVPTESKMSVSRRQLTSKELVAQKLVRAEKLIKINELKKAEELFEEVLIIEPSHKQARKNLAALWFGRKSYQQATNLLSQGISLDRSDAELRLLKARIHLQQGQHKAAYNTLKPLSLIKQQEYQVMLANVSQQIEQYKSAIQAYKILIDMQAYSGRWHLGLAIVYDRNSQFSLAGTEYALALAKSDLSIASAEFAQQRMQALGE
ncbi:MAG: tetratricopeptide repeat protein [Colwellia sp.]|nr:tetratricopeptide repeat protein [Colwellia sp.]